MNDQSNNTELHKNYLVTNVLDTIKYVLGNDIYYSLNEALQNYINEVTNLSINYSHVNNDLIRNQLEELNTMMIGAKARNDFTEFCRCAGLKIESVLEYFNQEKENDNNYQEFKLNHQEELKKSGIHGKFRQYYYWYYYLDVKNTHKNYNYWDVVNLFKIRNAASHKDLYTKSIVDQLQKNNRNSDPIIRFYNERNFEKVKFTTKLVVNTTLTNLKIINKSN